MRKSFRSDSSLFFNVEGARPDKRRQHPLLDHVLHPPLHQVDQSLTFQPKRRLTGLYAIVLGLQATLVKFFATGVQSGTIEYGVNACKETWWLKSQNPPNQITITFLPQISASNQIARLKDCQVDQFAVCEQPEMGEWELLQLPWTNMVSRKKFSKLYFLQSNFQAHPFLLDPLYLYS